VCSGADVTAVISIAALWSAADADLGTTATGVDLRAWLIGPVVARQQHGAIGRWAPAAWDHLEVGFASSMGPPFRQLWDHPGASTSGVAAEVAVAT
jgi:hypothetical protein